MEKSLIRQKKRLVTAVIATTVLAFSSPAAAIGPRIDGNGFMSTVASWFGLGVQN